MPYVLHTPACCSYAPAVVHAAVMLLPQLVLAVLLRDWELMAVGALDIYTAVWTAGH